MVIVKAKCKNQAKQNEKNPDGRIKLLKIESLVFLVKTLLLKPIDVTIKIKIVDSKATIMKNKLMMKVIFRGLIWVVPRNL